MPASISARRSAAASSVVAAGGVARLAAGFGAGEPASSLRVS